MRGQWYVQKAGVWIFLMVFSVILCLDYFSHGTKPANFDGTAHITTIAQFYQALKGGDFPVGWTDGFANYGLPLGQISHQIPIYLGALLTFATHDPLLSFHLTYFIATVLAGISYYLFVRNFFDEKISLVVTGIYLLAPYRIINLYLRGAMPEYFASIWPPLVMHILYRIYRDKPTVWSWHYSLLAAACAGLLLTHPLLTVVYTPLIVIFFLCFFPSVRSLVGTMIAAGVSLGLSAYYLVPLLREDRFLYHGISGSQYTQNQATEWATFLDPFWQYTCAYRNDIYGRCHLIKAGVTETVLMIVVVILFLLWIIQWKKHRQPSIYSLMHISLQRRLLMFIIFTGTISVILSTALLEAVYMRFSILGNIQFPWRFMSAYLFLPPLALGYLLTYHLRKLRDWMLILIFLIFCVMRFPQLYGKNYMFVPQSAYYFTQLNLHSFMLNTIWSGDTVDYPIKRQKAEIVQGKGQILSREIHNSWRRYRIRADESVKVSDSTFYFPGWQISVDGIEKPTDFIQFQDPAWRGVITFQVPAGTHDVYVYYTDTKVRKYAKVLTLMASVIFVVYGVGCWLAGRRRGNTKFPQSGSS